MPAARYIELSETEDQELKEIENNQGLAEKVRLRAKVIRLSQRQMSIEEIANYSGRHRSSIRRDFDRWEAQGVEGLADRASPGQASQLGEKERGFICEKLAEERAWTASTLAEEVNKKFKLSVNRESMRVCLLELGYSWQRQRYVPIKTPDSKVLNEAKETLEGLKKAEEGEITLKYLDEAGFSLSLPLSYTWSLKNHPLCVPKHWGNAGRINVIGTLSCSKDKQQLE
jgi:transposase